MKTEDSKKTVCAFLTYNAEKRWPEAICVDKETAFAGQFEKLCKAKVIQTYSTMSETPQTWKKQTD